LGYLDTVAATFPGASIVHCHRDPADAIASYASLTLAVRAPYTGELSPFDVGRHVLNRCTIAMRRALGVRDQAGDDAFVDVCYTDLVADPLEVVREIYHRVGCPLDPDAASAMAHWLSENPQHKHGPHRYSLDQFGLTAADLSAGLGHYTERFNRQLA
jgi:hypothetical protein